ncbi:MAG: hypothetical protein ACE5DY_03390 [Mariprofundaceae bacterium]
MNDYLLSFCLYAIAANLIAIPVMIRGRKKVQWHRVEYLFIYVPWFAFVALAMVVFGGLDQLPEISSIKTFIVVLQSIGSGVMGGLILLPRMAIKKPKLHPVMITALSSLVVAIIYTKFRMMLFIMIAALSSASS